MYWNLQTVIRGEICSSLPKKHTAVKSTTTMHEPRHEQSSLKNRILSVSYNHCIAKIRRLTTYR